MQYGMSGRSKWKPISFFCTEIYTQASSFLIGADPYKIIESILVVYQPGLC